MVRREVIGHAARRADRGDRVLENQMIHAAMLDDERKAIEVLDTRFELAAVEQVDGDGQFLAARVIEKDVLNIRRTGLRFRHEQQVPRQAIDPDRPAIQKPWRALPATRRGRQTR